MTEGRWRRRWTALVLLGVAAGMFVGGVQQAVRGLMGGEPWDWADMAVSTLVWAAVGSPAMLLIWRAVDRGRFPQSPSARVRGRQSRPVAPAMRSGVLPPDAHPDVWWRALRAEVGEWNGLRWLAAVYAAVAAGLVGLAAVLANDNAWGVWLVAIVVAMEGVAAYGWAERQRRVAQRLLSDLAGR